MNPNHPSSCDDPQDERQPKHDVVALKTVARQLMAAIAMEPVPDRLRDLAAELGKALEQRREEKMARHTTP